MGYKDPKHKEYLDKVEQASLLAHEIIAKDPRHDLSDLIRSFLNFHLTPEELFRRGLRRYD